MCKRSSDILNTVIFEESMSLKLNKFRIQEVGPVAIDYSLPERVKQFWFGKNRVNVNKFQEFRKMVLNKYKVSVFSDFMDKANYNAFPANKILLSKISKKNTISDVND